MHYWKVDNGNIGYENVDYLISKNPNSIYYEPKFIDYFNKTLYVSGVFKSKIFTWSWNLEDISSEIVEEFYDKVSLEIDDFLVSKMVEDGIYFVIKDKLIKYKNKEIEWDVNLNSLLDFYLL